MLKVSSDGDCAVLFDAIAMTVLNSSFVMSLLNISSISVHSFGSSGRVICHTRCCLVLLLVSYTVDLK